MIPGLDIDNFSFEDLPPELKAQGEQAANELLTKMLDSFESLFFEVAAEKTMDPYTLQANIYTNKKKLLAEFTEEQSPQVVQIVEIHSRIKKVFLAAVKTRDLATQGVLNYIIKEKGGIKAVILQTFEKAGKVQLQFNEDDNLEAIYLKDGGWVPFDVKQLFS